MKKTIIFLCLALFFIGCYDKKIVVHEPLKNELLAYTSKAEIIDEQNHILIIATYLNPIYQSKISINNEEKFLVAVSPKENAINLTSIKVNNDANTIVARELEPSDELLELTGFNMPWAGYYEISSPTKDSDNLKLTFEIYPSNQVELDFRKVSKSLYWNP
ncbi:hypothetical protein CCAL9344_02985 [Campylobacter sp. RM9344]|uniref:Lipoprotein n=1 Tax=Campylobacter californiensis TaxID=1032243 RepID=A0AAW3ZSE8_9BACT|nr:MULTISPECIES: hypothetical protein [unclassified Campylobacter]MBE2984716.1 hypothetical protein [Campylobacter sp. RM6883]MBE2986906.1 hypothetical protein [Campylobacter sp. RM12919]MBE2987806.1 hypothetical protein [Campylobacter sp. RM12920]MBE2994632.1 hypothetical protein [Campylobacter sp. RM6913]MBE3029158.1 hypothetical protein [Campylobacter sp. RM9344]